MNLLFLVDVLDARLVGDADVFDCGMNFLAKLTTDSIDFISNPLSRLFCDRLEFQL